MVELAIAIAVGFFVAEVASRLVLGATFALLAKRARSKQQDQFDALMQNFSQTYVSESDGTDADTTTS